MALHFFSDACEYSLNKEYNPTRKMTKHVILYCVVGSGGLDSAPGSTHGNREDRF